MPRKMRLAGPMGAPGNPHSPAVGSPPLTQPSQTLIEPLAATPLPPGLKNAQLACKVFAGSFRSRSQRSSTVLLRVRYVPFRPTEKVESRAFSTPNVYSYVLGASVPESSGSPVT